MRGLMNAQRAGSVFVDDLLAAIEAVSAHVMPTMGFACRTVDGERRPFKGIVTATVTSTRTR